MNPLDFGISTSTANSTETASQEYPEQQEEESSSSASIAGPKRKNPNPVPKFIDEKRKFLQKKLCASERDKVLIDGMKEDAAYRKQMVDAMQKSNDTMSSSLKTMATAMQSMASGMNMFLQFQMLKAGYPIPPSLMNQSQVVPQNEVDESSSERGRQSDQLEDYWSSFNPQ